MIVVTNHLYAPSDDIADMRNMTGKVCDLIVEDCVPFIDRRFRTIPDKAHRALAGLSMGAYVTMQMTREHPEFFDWLGVFSPGRGNSYWSYLETETPENIAKFNADHRLLYFSQGMQEGGENLPGYMETLRSVGVNCEYFRSEGVHEWQTWRKAAHDFSQRIFR